MTDRCPGCPRTLPGPCFAQTSGARHLCEAHARGDTKYLSLLDGSAVVTRHGGSVPPDPPAYPPLWRQAASLAGAVVTHVAAGLPTLDAEAVAARLAVCAGCPEHVAAENRCQRCGCSLSVKAGWADQKCPLDKWPTTP